MKKRNIFGTAFLSLLMVFFIGVIIGFFQLFNSIDLDSENNPEKQRQSYRPNPSVPKSFDINKINNDSEKKPEQSVLSKENNLKNQQKSYYEIIEEAGKDRKNKYLENIEKLRNIDRVNPETLGVQVPRQGSEDLESSSEDEVIGDENKETSDYVKPEVRLLNPNTLKLKSTEIIRNLNKKILKAVPPAPLEDKMIPETEEDNYYEDQ